MRLFKILLACAALLSGQSAHAFSPPEDTKGALTVRIADPGEVTALGKPVAVPVTLVNSGDAALLGTLRVWVTDDWRVVGADKKTAREAKWSFAVPAKSEKTIAVAVIAGKGSYAALYPIHAQAEAVSGLGKLAPHAILIVGVAQKAIMNAAPPKTLPTLQLARTLRLDTPDTFQPGFAIAGANVQALPAGWQGTDTATGTNIVIQDMDRGGRRRAIAIHPPWRAGWGDAVLDYRVALPNTQPLSLEFATAIRDNGPTEPPSDGVDFRVFADDGTGWKLLFSRFSISKSWETARVNLSGYAGKTIALRLFTGPGLEHNTSCDQAYWGTPTLIAGIQTIVESGESRVARRVLALSAALAAFNGRDGDWAWQLKSEAGTTGAAIVLGPQGFSDAQIAFVQNNRVLTFDGFTVEIDGQNANWTTAPGELAERNVNFDAQTRRGVFRQTLPLTNAAGNLVQAPVEIRIWAEKGALRVSFAMPGVKRDAKGEPRFTRLQIGPANAKARRIYAGFGNVLENPGRLDIGAGGFTLSTRHVGADFDDSLSLVQATDIFPDAFSVDPATRRCALVAHHDATFSFVPSEKGAFAAARVYRQIAGFQPAGGVAKLQGKMCLDQWGGDYKQAAQDIEKAAAYGLTDAIFVKHVWQRWGYDYRLPDIYPPAGNFADFKAMVAACKKSGILFAPHDNYIDFYPDATGFSYEKIIFNADGTPQKAWFNESRKAQSYRWLPTAFAPWQEANLKAMKSGFAPDGLFVDVFTAIAPMDFYDRAGRFYPKTVTQQKWGESFDRAREIFGNNAPQISEAGTDALIGHLDGAQSDHSGWFAPGTQNERQKSYFSWNYAASDGERVPWHDMASHGSFVLLAGGLGDRYSGGQDNALHGYGSDDYLSLTVLGGRNPMCDGPFNRRAVMTYWLLHDVCAKLARGEMLSHTFLDYGRSFYFSDDNIHRQSVAFSSGKVSVNRGATDWRAYGLPLPQYGFFAETDDCEASIARRDGVITGFSRSPGVLFADARPPSSDGGAVRPRVLGMTQDGRKVRFKFEWEVLQPTSAANRPFLHFVEEKPAQGEGIAFQGNVQFDAVKLGQPGKYAATAEATLPEALKTEANYALRVGLYDPKSGARLPLAGPNDSNGRAKNGRLTVVFKDGQPVAVWLPEGPDAGAAAREARLNMAGKIVDFGPVATNGAFRLQHSGNVWTLTPLPHSLPFDFTLKLNQLGAKSTRISGITSVGINGEPLLVTKINRVNDNFLHFKTDGAFAYKIRFTP